MLPPGTVIAGYRIEGVLGYGGMGVVYEATQLSLDRLVALKVLAPQLRRDETFAARFRREGQVQAALDHPHVVSVYEAGETEEGLFLAMRLVRGPNLKELLYEDPPGAERTMRLLGPIADALDAAHADGLVHRDIKPQNILVGRGDHAYLADFGLGKAPGAQTLTVAGQMAGTASYISPEQVEGGSGTEASDVYSLAAVVFECLTGRPPFVRDSEGAILYAHIHEPPPKASELEPELPPAVDDALRRGLAKDPADRPPTALALMESVGDALGLEVEGPRKAAPPEERPAPARRPKVVLGTPGTESTRAEPARARRRWPLALAAVVAAVLSFAGGAAGVFALTGEWPGQLSGEEEPSGARAGAPAPPRAAATTPEPRRESAFEARTIRPGEGIGLASLGASRAAIEDAYGSGSADAPGAERAFVDDRGRQVRVHFDENGRADFLYTFDAKFAIPTDGGADLDLSATIDQARGFLEDWTQLECGGATILVKDQPKGAFTVRTRWQFSPEPPSIIEMALLRDPAPASCASDAPGAGDPGEPGGGEPEIRIE